MKKLFYATKNKFKIQSMKNRLNELDIEIITPYDLNIDIDIEEDGNTVTENATKKAQAYTKLVDMPIIAGDSALYIEKFKVQPGLHVRRINGKYLNDDELERYYSTELKKIGGESIAYYITGLALINKDKIHTIEIRENDFLMTSKIYNGERNNDALGRLEVDIKSNKYFCEITNIDKKNTDSNYDKKCVEFIKNNI